MGSMGVSVIVILLPGGAGFTIPRGTGEWLVRLYLNGVLFLKGL